MAPVAVPHDPCTVAPVFLRLALASGLWLLACLCLAAPYNLDTATTEELRARDGLPNFLSKATAGDTVRVAYLGGSITAAAGWRPKSLEWFRRQYPQAQFAEINAAISGTGSDFAACRLQEDVLVQNPDLVFLECRVNGGGGFEAQSVEGVVRHIWRESPRTDICFIYTIGEWMIPGIREGNNTGFGSIMESIANHYGIPTIDLALEVVRQLDAGTLVFKADQEPEGKLAFSRDGVHPGDGGHDIYRDVIARSILAMEGVGSAAPHELVAPLAAEPWENATLLPIAEATLSAGWESVDMATDPVTSADAGRTRGMLRATMKTAQQGASITVGFRGTAVGFSDIPGVEPIELEATIDGETTIPISRRSPDGMRKYARFWYTPELPPGEHTVRFTVKSLPEGVAFYAGQLLIAGEPR